MNCDNFQVWRPLPVNSNFVIKATGNDAAFNVVVAVNANGVHEAVWRHEALVAGKTRTIAANDICTFHVFVVVFHEPQTGDNIKIEAHIERPDGTTDPKFDCKW